VSILVANKVYGHFWSLVFGERLKLDSVMGPYCEQEI